MEEEKSRRSAIRSVTIIILIFVCIFLIVQIQKLAVENNLLRHEVKGLKDEKRWIWRNAVTKRIKYGEPRIEWDQIIIPVMGLNEKNETLFVANASLPFETENCGISLFDGRLFAHAIGDIQQLNQQIESLRADVEFYKQQYNYYFKKYMENQPKDLQLLISNQTAFLPLWNITVELTIQNVHYQIPFLNRTVNLAYYRISKTYGYCGIEIRNFTNVQQSSFPILSLEMTNGSYAKVEWKLISEDETKYVVQQSLRLENVTFRDGNTIQDAELTLLHEIHKQKPASPQQGGDPTCPKAISITSR